MKIYLKLEAPFEWARVSAHTVVAFGEVPALSDYPVNDDDEVIGVVSGEWVTTHRVNLPAKTRKQFNIALPYSLEESISEDVDNMHFVCPSWKAGSESTVFVVAKSKMLEWQTSATESRLPVNQLVPDYSLVPFHEVADCSIAQVGSELLVNHRNGEGVSIDKSFVDTWLVDIENSDVIAVNDELLTEALIKTHPARDIRFWAFGNKLAHWLDYEQALTIDLWSDSYRPRVSRKNMTTFLMPLIIIALSVFIKLGYDSYRYFTLHAEIVTVNREAKALLKQRFPFFNNVTPGAERERMEQAIARMGGPDKSNSVHDTLAQIALILVQQRISLSEIVYREDVLVITCLLNDFSQLDLLTKRLNQRPKLQAALQSSAAENGKVVASYSIKRTEI
jgi:type II secretion system protein L